MTKVIIMSGGSLDSFYEQTIQYLHDKYHTYPSSLLGISVSEAEATSQSYHSAMGRHMARNAGNGYKYGSDGQVTGNKVV